MLQEKQIDQTTLVLSRRAGESFTVGNSTIKVVKDGRTVKLAITADRSTPIMRSELLSK